MAEKNRHGLHAVREEEIKEVEQSPDLKVQIRSHRFKVFLRTIILIAALVGLVVGIVLYFSYRSYSDYEVQSEYERTDTSATLFEEYAKGLLKYSNDGAFYTGLDNTPIWNQTYEMEHPKADITESFVAIGDIGGTEIYILDESGQQGKISTVLPIYKFSVAAQGTIAVLLADKNDYYLKLFDATGNELASGQLFVKNSGYPIAMALAQDAKKLAIAAIDPTGHSVQSEITFYNFGSVGQNEPDNIVGTFTYEDLVITQMSFMNADTLAVFGDKEVQIYAGAEKPELKSTLPIEKEIRSIFYNDTYFGLIFNNEDEENSRHLEIYDQHCKNVLDQDFRMDYEKVSFLKDNEICLQNDFECKLIGINGVERFLGQFDVPLIKIVEEYFGMYYTFVLEGKTQKVRLI